MRAQPHSSSAVHHHGDQDTLVSSWLRGTPMTDINRCVRIVYAVSGRGSIASLDEEGNEQKRILNPGDWALIPANREHKEVNDGDEEVVWVIVRAPGGTPEVVNLTEWKGEEEK